MNSPTSQSLAVTRSVEYRIVRISWPTWNKILWAQPAIVSKTNLWLSFSTDNSSEVFKESIFQRANKPPVYACYTEQH